MLYSYNSTSIWPVPDQLRALLVPCVILGELFSIWAIWGRPLSVPFLIRTTAKQARLNMRWIWLLWVLGEYGLDIIELWTWAVSPLYVHNVQPPWAPLQIPWAPCTEKSCTNWENFEIKNPKARICLISSICLDWSLKSIFGSPAAPEPHMISMERLIGLPRTLRNGFYLHCFQHAAGTSQ